MQTIIVDLGGVLVEETTQVRDAAKRLGVAPHEIAGSYWSERDAWDRGASNHEYWSAVAASAGVDITEEVAEDLALHDATLWTRLRPAARQILADLAQSPAPVWVLSNAAAVFEQVIDASDWREFVDGRFVSGALGMMKPDPAIFEHVEQALGTDPSELHFIDDRPGNVAAATTRGWQAELWTSDAQTRAWLVGLGVLDE